MALPRDRFEVAWTAGPWDTAPFWVDCTTWLKEIGRERGRQPRDAVNRASKLTAKLDNRDGRFTMQNGPAFGASLVAEAGPTWSVGGTSQYLVGGARATSTGASLSFSSGFINGVAASTVYQVRLMVMAVSTVRTPTITVQWWDASAILRSDTFSWTESRSVPFARSITSPAGATRAYIYVDYNSIATGEVHEVTLAAVVASATPLPPYWPNVEPRRPCRWQTDHNGTTYARFEGLLESLPTEWTDFADETATFTAAGRLAALADADLPGSVWETTMKGLAPTHWWKFDDQETVSQFSDSGAATAPAKLGGTVQASRAEAAPMMSGSARLLEPGAFITADCPELAGTGDWTIGVVAQLDLARPAGDGYYLTYPLSLTTTTNGAADPVIVVRLHNRLNPPEWYTKVELQTYNPAGYGQQYFVNSPDVFRPLYTAVQWVSLVVQRASGALSLWMNGEQLFSFAYSGVLPSSTIFKAGIAVWVDGTYKYNRVVLDDAFVFTRALTATEIGELSAAVAAPWAGDTDLKRFDRIAPLTGIPAARMTHGTIYADAGPTLGRTHLAGKAVTYLHQLARSVRGRILDTTTGNILLRTGGDLLNMRTSVATFGQQAGDLPYEHISTDPSFDRIVTAARAKNVEGTVQETVATDLVPGSTMSYVTRYGRRGPTEGEIGDLLLADDRQADDYTSWLVNAGKRPDVALDPLVLHPLGDDAVTAVVLAADLDNVYTVRKKHPAQAQTITTTARLAGIRETRTRRSWSVEWRLEPLDPTPYILADGTYLADGTQIAY